MADHIVPNCFYRVSAKALIFDDQQRFLLAQEQNGVRDFPGGGIDHHEHPTDAFAREIHEEMGIQVTHIDPLPSYFLTAKRKSTDQFFANVLYRTELEHYNFAPSDECVALRFFSPDELDDPQVYFTVHQFATEFFS